MSLRTVLFSFKEHFYCFSQLDWAFIVTPYRHKSLNVSTFNLHLSGLNTLPPILNSLSTAAEDQMSNSIDHYQTAPDLGVHCLLRYISVPIFGVNTVSDFAASVTNTTIY